MLSLFNSLTGKIEPFQHAEQKSVRMYTCGPSTYQRPHIGNYRTFLFEDIVQRYIEYLGYNVKRLITLTDVEDKAIVEAKKENLMIEELTSKNEALFFQDFKLLKIKTPDFSIRASSAVDQAAYLISQLIEKGIAYWHTHDKIKNAYFDVLSFPGFGKLAHLDMTKWPIEKRRFHKDTYPGTPWNRGDFILWHGCGLYDVCYLTPIGSGRPAWNVQDAAIVTKHFGFSVDVACGGIDNLVRHHDYTLAIAEAVSNQQFSRFWLHGAHLFVNGKKMSKSLGNVIYPSDILAKGYSGAHLRFFLIYWPYRQKRNFTFENLAQTSRKLDTLREMIKELDQVHNGNSNAEVEALIENIVPEFEKAMNNNLDVKTAFNNLYIHIARLFKMQEMLTMQDSKNLSEKLHRIDSVFQCIF